MALKISDGFWYCLFLVNCNFRYFFAVYRLQEKLLPLALLSEIQIMLDKGADRGREQQFLQQVDGWLIDKDKNDLLSSQYCEELAAIFLIQDKAALAKHQVERSFTMFLNRWTELNPLAHKLRAKYLLDLQKTAELQVCGFIDLGPPPKNVESVACII
jgi:hypothetical protein